MSKIKNLFFSFIILLSFEKILSAEIKIVRYIDDEIITNYDIEKEIKYLEILNPSLINLDKDKKFIIAKDTLTKELIKKKELKKFLDINKKNKFTDNELKKLYTRLNYANQEEFENRTKEKININELKKKIEIEIYWNELIYSKYKNQIKIDKNKILKKINILKNKKYKEYKLSEIIFSKKKNINLDDLFKQIKLSISEIGFNNTATIYSIADSAKFGGNVGWISENNLSKDLIQKIRLLQIGETSEILKIGNNFLILQLDDLKFKNNEINEQREFENLEEIETNNQLNTFSKIYFDKIKKNYSINEN